MRSRLAYLVLLSLSVAHAGASAAPAAASPAAADSTPTAEPSPCNQGDETVWPLVDAYARAKSLPPAESAMASYRYLVLRILDTCKDGDTLVLGDRDGSAGAPFRRLMVEFCEEPEIKADKAPGVDAQRYPTSSRLSCTVTKINALKGFPTIKQPVQSSVITPVKP